MTIARWRLKSPRSLSGTSPHVTMVTEVNIMVVNGWLTSFSFIINRPSHSWNKAISDSDLEIPRSRSWLSSKGKVIQSAQYHINSLPFHSTSIRPTVPEIELFRNLTLNHPKSRSWVRSKVKVIYFTQCPTNALPFISHQSDQPFLRYGQNSVWSSSTFPQTHIFFVPNIKGLAQMVLTWEGKNFAAADADADVADEAET